MADFAKAFQFMIPHEIGVNRINGYKTDPDDPGGETKWGISRRTYPHIDIKNLTQGEACLIYKRDFWNRIRGDEITNQDLANKFFDISVNTGVFNAVQMIQVACVKCDFPMRPDGIIGDKTLTSINLSKPEKLMAEFKTLAREHYQDLAHSHPALKKYLSGWLRRASE